MKNKSIDLIVANAVASVEMEGYITDEQVKDWCKQFLKKEITKEEYIRRVIRKAGVS